MRQTFRKKERLKSSRVVKTLFFHGNSFLLHPYRVNWIVGSREGKYPARILIGVSRKNIKKASERNHLKRLCREAYRKNKYLLYDYLNSHNLSCDFSVIFIGSPHTNYAVIEKKIILLLERLISELEFQPAENKTL
ncbi:MAG: ribonuclease P protein component [Bacteroidales bacterium]|nr:ribonuclease P protein component [Bacteroidales bacterium]